MKQTGYYKSLMKQKLGIQQPLLERDNDKQNYEVQKKVNFAAIFCCVISIICIVIVFFYILF